MFRFCVLGFRFFYFKLPNCNDLNLAGHFRRSMFRRFKSISFLLVDTFAVSAQVITAEVILAKQGHGSEDSAHHVFVSGV